MNLSFYPIASKATILNLDADIEGNYLAITEKNEILGLPITITIDEVFRFPQIRLLTEGRFLVADSRTNASVNAFIYDLNGQLQTSFLAGDGIEDILILKDKIVFSYFDQGVFGKDGPNNEGLTVFDFNGNFLYGFNNASGGLIADCYAICKLDNNKILCYPYTDFPLIELDTATYKWKIHETSKEYRGSHAMVSWYGKVIFHESYDRKNDFFLWDIWQQKIEHIGSYEGLLRGLNHGKFLELVEGGFNIISPME